MNFNEALKNRRSQYDLGKNSSISNQRVEEIIKECITYSPTAFHSQSSRAVVLFGNRHERFWGIVSDTLKAIVPPAAFSQTATKLAGFAAGCGTILYFEEMDTVSKLQKDFPLYSENFPIWSNQSSGMFQLAVWTALSAEGLGASLQHYNPLIDDAVHAEFSIPSSWKLLGQMPFGSINSQPKPLIYNDADARVLVQGGL